MTRLSGQAPVVDSRHFRHVVGHLASGVTIITTALEDGTCFGMTASSVTSLSADPPMMIACLNNAVPTATAVARSGVYAVNVLGLLAGGLAHQFATPSADKFSGVHISKGVTGAPLIGDALANLECEVVETVVGGTHTVFLGRVVAAEARSGPPLTYFRGGFGRFELSADDHAYIKARTLVLERAFAVGDAIHVDDLARTLEVNVSTGLYVITRLQTDGFVRREPNGTYLVMPFDIAASDATFEARAAIQTGVIEQVGAVVRPADLERLRASFEEMAALLVGDEFVDFDSYLDANYRFHEGLVGLAQNNILSSMFSALAIRQVMTRSFGSTPKTSQRFIDVQQAIIAALENHDVAAAKAAVRQYTDLAKARVREIIGSEGGFL